MRHQRIIAAPAYVSTALFLLLTPACGDDDEGVDASANTQFDGGVETSSGSSGGRGGSASGARAGTGGARAGNAGAAATSGSPAGRSASAGTAASAGAGASSAPRPIAGRAASAGTGTGIGTGTGGADIAGRAGQAGQTASAALSDAEIVSVLVAVNEGEVQQNTLAVSKALAPSARAFAEDLVGAHQAAQMRLSTLLTTLNLSPSDNPIAQQLRAASAQLVTRLQDESDVTFDMLYLQSQIDVHSRVLALIDDTLLAEADESLLRSELVVVRTEVAAHLSQARALAVALSLDVDAGTIDVDAGL